ncbi:VP4 [Pata virus]|nr:VP4 [Pata virus]
MPEPHAVIYTTKELEPLIKGSFLPVWELSGEESLNELWIQNGKYSSDVYCCGPIKRWTYRQLRGHGFIFVSTEKMIQLADISHFVDIRIPKVILSSKDVKKFETEIGRKRLKMRKMFGDILRRYALLKAIELHGSEAETLNQANPRVHEVYGLPEIPPHYDEFVTNYDAFEDEPTDEKLVSMLDYLMYSAEEVHYVGSGDGRTLELFRKRSPERFNRAIWHLYDPIAPQTTHNNVFVHRAKVEDKRILLSNMNMLKRVERLLIWDVSSDRERKTDTEWESERFGQDRLGEEIAYELSGAFALALIKHRVPQLRDTYNCISSIIFPQPSAPREMYELRNLLNLRGYSHVNREHIPSARTIEVRVNRLRDLVEKFHGIHRGKKLKKQLYEYIHIMYKNGLRAEGEQTRADLFYLTNSQNFGRWREIKEVILKSQIATLWVGRAPLFDYNDYVVDRAQAMLELSTRETRVLDGNGAVLYLIWKYPEIFKRGLTYDPAWAMNFVVTLREPIPHPAVPDVSLCRFIGLRVESSLLRLRNPRLHEIADELKKIGLDVSGHLYVTLMSGAYATDLYWWFYMIMMWSPQGRENKISDLKASKSEVIEWKDEMADKPWHLRPDLIAALKEYDFKTRIKGMAPIDRWIDLLHSL